MSLRLTTTSRVSMAPVPALIMGIPLLPSSAAAASAVAKKEEEKDDANSNSSQPPAPAPAPASPAFSSTITPPTDVHRFNLNGAFLALVALAVLSLLNDDNSTAAQQTEGGVVVEMLRSALLVHVDPLLVFGLCCSLCFALVALTVFAVAVDSKLRDRLMMASSSLFKAPRRGQEATTTTTATEDTTTTTRLPEEEAVEAAATSLV